ncbi:MAG TPA: SO2930 family diheme c-type cytochrome, partial [Pseudomonadales bacterium]
YAHKLRAVWLPPGTRTRYDATGVFDFPVGTLIQKTFYSPRAPGQPDAVIRTDDETGEFDGARLDLARVRLIETRLLVRQETGWDALTYVWDDAQRTARLEIAGDIKQLRVANADGAMVNLTYVVPTRNECANCHATNHTTGELHPIGPAARHLNKTYAHYVDGPAPQLQRWVDRGYLDQLREPVPANALWRAGATDDLDHRARSYLDVNCGHCHSPTGAADTSGLFLNAAEVSWRRLGLCKTPVAAGRGTGGREVSIEPGDPDASILIFRVASTDPAIMMPELGRTTVHEQGVELLRSWVESLRGDCMSRGIPDKPVKSRSRDRFQGEGRG